ncbi:MAG: SUMF1/EgtB/PvdO family nonheme iron enzyme [Kiritimatiellae bacterium]|nr:SUMF1/EgtB/PvdO family nonheme iron enzyme [Kiritimatiellia bacterium]
MKKILMVAALAAMGAGAAPVVEITSVQQQYPWTNTVDITYTSTGIAEENTYYVVFKAQDSAGKEIDVITNALKVSQGSTWVAQWQPPFNVRYENCTMTPYVYKGGQDDYMIVDLETWKVAFEGMSTQDASNEKYNTNEYKTKKLVLRKIAGDKSYTIGHNNPSATSSDNRPNTVHQCFVPRDYYEAIFICTRGQYRRIMNDTSIADSEMPMGDVSWNTIRGSAGVTADPSETCVLGLLNSKTKSNGFGSGRGFDLPTESMWEIAARAGVETRYLWGDTTSGYSDWCWAMDNSGKAIKPVGGKKPNNWGLYDVNGNVDEIVRDVARNSGADLAAETAQAQNVFIPISQGKSTGRVLRGLGGANCDGIDSGWYQLSISWHAAGASSTWGHVGFRIAYIPE